MLFVPEDVSNSYIVTHWTNPASWNLTDGSPIPLNLLNTTQTLPAPPSKDGQAAYAASASSLVQIDTQGNIHYLENAVNSDYTVNSGAQWTKMNYQFTGAPPAQASATSPDASASGSAAPSSPAASNGASSAGSAAPSGSAPPKSAASPLRSGVVGAVVGVVALAVAAIL